MKKFNFFAVAMILTLFTANAQLREVGPTNSIAPANGANAIFDLQFQYNIGSTGGAGVDGLAGVILFNNEYWVSEWATDVIHVFSDAGAWLESFTIAGVSGARSFTTDGTSIYVGGGSLNIYEIDPVTRTLTNTIGILTGTDSEARMCTYDPTLDGGAGGFWVGDFGSDIISIGMFGNELSVIPAADHGTVIYGGAIDNISVGGPFLWIHDQSGAAPSRDFITQISIATGLPTGVVYDYTIDGFAFGATDVLAGGLFISDEAVSGFASLVGVCQCTPSNQIFGLELMEVLGTNTNELSEFSIYPNPSNGDKVIIETSLLGDKQVSVFDVLGKQVINTQISNNELNVSALDAGIYMVRVTQNGVSATKKLIKN